MREGRRTVLAAVAFLLAVGLRAAARAEECVLPHAPFQKGFTLGGWSRDDYESTALASQLRALKAAGVEWVALTPRWLQEHVGSTTIAPSRELSPSDESVRHAVRAAHAEGLRVFLKPHVGVLSGRWRGDISFRSEANWAAWFRSYADFLSHYARLAREERVELLAVGVELDSTTHREADWRRLAASARAAFAGPLVYAANWGRERGVAWWDALDYAGVNAYFPVARRPDASLAELESAWGARAQDLGEWAGRICRPVLLTEIGYRSIRGAGVRPWDWKQRGEASPAEQERLYRAALGRLWRESWLSGLYWWQWGTSPPRDPATDTDYTPQGKPALSVLREFYSGDVR